MQRFQHHIWVILVVFSLVFAMAACGNDDTKDVTDGDAPADGDAPSDGDEPAATDCVELALDLHEGSGQAFVDLVTMEVTNEDVDTYDFVMVNEMPNPPAIYLGSQTSALDLGDGLAFDDVTEIPADGFEADTNEQVVIGTNWRAGGSGTTGHEMNNHVFVLKLGSGHYAKIMVTSAVQGQITIDAFTTAADNLTCAWPED